MKTKKKAVLKLNKKTIRNLTVGRSTREAKTCAMSPETTGINNNGC